MIIIRRHNREKVSPKNWTYNLKKEKKEKKDTRYRSF